MNSTRRILNRTLLTLVGIVLTSGGAFTAWAGLSPEVAGQWTHTGKATLDRIDQSLRATPIPGTTTSWWTAATLLAIILAIFLLVSWTASQGGGRVNSVGTHTDAGHGSTTVDVSFAAQAITAATAGNPQILTTTVTAWKTKGSEALKITVQPRQGASPADIDAAVQEAVAGLDTALGEQIPVLLRIGTGTRARLTRRDRVH